MGKMEIDTRTFEMNNVNHENYEQGLVKSYELGFQDRDWYKKNKDNFSNSLKNKYPNYLPSYAKKSEKLPNNYLGFYPDEYIRFGKLDQVKMNVEGNDFLFWVIKIPKGLNIYHSSRSVGLNHGGFPIPNYNNDDDSKTNKPKIFNYCPIHQFLGNNISDVISKNICTHISYYSSPYLTQSYLKKGTFGGDQIKYDYGINEKSNNKLYNDRISIQSNENLIGVQSYILKKDSYFLILGLDDFLIDRPDLGRDNMKNFKKIMKYLSPKIKSDMNIDTNTMDNFLNLINSVTGSGTLQDNADIIMRDYKSKNFDNVLKKWIINSASVYNNPNTVTNTAGYIKNIAKQFKNKNIDLSLIKGVRFSTYEHDRPVMNMINWLFNNYKTKLKSSNETVQIEGFISSSMFVATKGGNSTIKNTPFTRNDLQYYKPSSTFHSEIGLFYAPDILDRNKLNKYDIDYSINYLGITQELRKYKTTNIMHYTNKNTVEGFHQGHLLEHSNWVGLISGNMLYEEPFSDYNNNEVDKDTHLIAGYIHDIGKSGKCIKTSVYKGMDHQDAKHSICNFVYSDNKITNRNNKEIVGMSYYDIPEHPERGYEYLKGYDVYEKYTLNGLDNEQSYNKNTKAVYFKDWEKMFNVLNVSVKNRKLIRIAVGAHWFFGDAIRKIVEKKSDKDYQKIIKDYINLVEIFFNDEFLHLNTKEFLTVLVFTITISFADILGSEYDLELIDDKLKGNKKNVFINFLPNISLNEDPQIIVSQIINHALDLQKDSGFKRKIFSNIRENIGDFLKNVSNEISNNFKFNQGNTYSILYNLINAYPSVNDIKTAYGNKFPKIIAFDLDQTLFAVSFKNNGLSEYYIYPETYKIMEDVQKLRKGDNPTIIAVTSRHYSPKSLERLLVTETYKNKPNPLFYKNFDYIISRYTGSYGKIKKDTRGYNNFLNINGKPEDGFKMDVKNNKRFIIPDNDTDFKDLDKVSKYGHFNLLKEKYNVEYKDMISFDDDKKYFTSKGLGLAGDVFVAGVLKSGNKYEQGITMPLFKQGISLYVFDKIKKM